MPDVNTDTLPLDLPELADPLLDRSWRDQGLCRLHDPELFFPSRGDSGEAAKAICATCPVKEPCLEFALATNERHGIWGGMSERQRRRLRRARRARRHAAA